MNLRKSKSQIIRSNKIKNRRKFTGGKSNEPEIMWAGDWGLTTDEDGTPMFYNVITGEKRTVLNEPTDSE